MGPAVNLLGFDGPLGPFAAAEAGPAVAPQRAPGGGRQAVLTVLEGLLARGLCMGVRLYSGSHEGAAAGHQQLAAVLYLPLVRQGQGAPKLQVHGHQKEKEGRKTAHLEVCLSASTVSFSAISSNESNGPNQERPPREQNILAGTVSQPRAPQAAESTEAADACTRAAQTEEATAPYCNAGGCCSVRLVTACGSLISFPGGPEAPIENRVAHDVLRIFAAFDFNTSECYLVSLEPSWAPELRISWSP